MARTAVHLIPVGITNAYALDGGDGLILIDTGVDTPEDWDALTTGVRSAGLRFEDIQTVLLTHAHFDHSGLAGRVRDVTGAQVLIHEDDAPLLSVRGGWGRQPGLRRLFLALNGVPEIGLRWIDANRSRTADWRESYRRQRPLFDRSGVFQPDGFAAIGDISQTTTSDTAHVDHASAEAAPWDRDPPRPDGTLRDGEMVEVGAVRVRTVHTPGHTPGHACFTLDDEGVLFIGDHVLRRTVPTAGVFFPDGDVARRTHGLPDYLRSLRLLLGIPARHVFPAHEEEIDDLPKSVERILRNYDRRTAQVLEAVRSAASTAFELLPRVFPTVRAAVLWPTMVELIGHLDVLEEAGLIVAERAGEVIRYRAHLSALAR